MELPSRDGGYITYGPCHVLQQLKAYATFSCSDTIITHIRQMYPFVVSAKLIKHLGKYINNTNDSKILQTYQFV